MTKNITCRTTYAQEFCDIPAAHDAIKKAAETLKNGDGPGGAYRGWYDLPRTYNREEFARIQTIAERIRAQADVFIVIGIGGSYLGARSAIDVLKGVYYNNQTKSRRDGPEIYFAGNNLSGAYLEDILSLMEGKSVYVNVISKSGTTLEPAAAFQVITAELAKRYSKEELQKRIFATTDATHGTLKTIADEQGYETFVVPEDIGGRYSVLSAVGLFPIAVAGIDIEQLMAGARDAMDQCQMSQEHNVCHQYAAARTALYRSGYKIDVLTTYAPAWHYFAEWWKQLFGESEGKDKKGLYPSSMDYTTDLHSLGQYVQDGERHLLKTILHVENDGTTLRVPQDHDVDQEEKLPIAGMRFDQLNAAAHAGTLAAHADGGVPQIVISIPEKNAYYLGQLYYFFQNACALSAYALGVNPFNQPGVEAYKKKMFAIINQQSV